MAERVDDVVDTAIAGAVVDLEAPVGERVRFDPRQLDAVLELGRDGAVRDEVVAVLRGRLSRAIMAMEPSAAEPVDWHDAQAAQALLNRVEATPGGMAGG
jgi:hypothetical protein